MPTQCFSLERDLSLAPSSRESTISIDQPEFFSHSYTRLSALRPIVAATNGDKNALGMYRD